ncbi:MAG TPA: YojF family protein [Candidatus Salinicoccus stercoripullorum]|uniref:YojF family protein n=1 Tax=Candidatus Salinicoccus stercoripullorum TaxID=2838756 RepID=A0A9D1U1J8_9STAP|nr:YojF family protein [Candidatus Salinicoccus stercoripullorum]
MKKINREEVQTLLNRYQDEKVYVHVEVTSGMYASHMDEKVFNAGMFMRNVQVVFSQGAIRGGGNGEFRVGLKLDNGGWIYVLGLTHFEVNDNDEFIMHGFNYDGKLASALEISVREFFK